MNLFTQQITNSFKHKVMRAIFTIDSTLSSDEIDERYERVHETAYHSWLPVVADKSRDVSEEAKIRHYMNVYREEFLQPKVSQEKFNQATSVFLDKRALAKNFLEIQPLYFDEAQLWWLWSFQETKWRRLDEVDILNLIHKSHRIDTVATKERTEILNALKQEARLNKPKEPKNSWVQFKGVIVDALTGGEYIATPEFFITNPIPWELSITEDTPTMDKIFEQWVGREYVQTLYEIVAYCLLRGYPIHRLFCLIGSGLNGKGKFLELLIRFIGKENVTTVELDTLLSSRFETTKLYKKLVCTTGETDFNEISKTSILKKLTGEDLISYEFKHKNPFEDYNYAKIIIATNNLPSTTDKTRGYYRRWLIIDFPNEFTEQEDILASIPQHEYNNLARKCLRVLKELLEKRTFHKEGTIEERMQRYEEKSNPLEKFWEECLKEDSESHIYKYSFKERLSDWCKQNHFREISDREIARFMQEKKVFSEKVDTPWFTDDGKTKKRYNAWAGIQWK